jgi:hypothetical protein
MKKHGRCISKNEVFKVEPSYDNFGHFRHFMVSYKSGFFWCYWFNVSVFSIEAIEKKALDVISSGLIMKVSSIDENGFFRYSFFLKA